MLSSGCLSSAFAPFSELLALAREDAAAMFPERLFPFVLFARIGLAP